MQRDELNHRLAASAAPGLDCRGICGLWRRFDDAELDDRVRVRARIGGGVTGCSGNSAAGTVDPGLTDPAGPAPDGGTDGQAAFDAALESAAQAQAADGGTPAEERVLDRWSARAGAARAAAYPEVHAVRRIRTNAAGDADSLDLLTAASFPTVPYEPGKVLISEGEASAGDTLPMWAYVTSHVPIHNQTAALTLTVNVRAGLRITPTGLVVEIGGPGAEGMDFRRTVDLSRGGNGGPSGLPGGVPDDRGWDLTLTFGEPTRSPEGNGEAYWAARLMPDPGQVAIGADADTRAKLLVGGRPYQIGTYKLWLSNHVGAETNLEPAEGSSAEAYPDDDENAFLKYAAYGMMTFATSDRFSRSTGNAGTGWNEVKDRIHGFHVGYYAFEDEDNKRTTDIGEAVSEGKFAGFTIALEFGGISRGSINGPTAADLNAARRLRGDVELTATITGTASANTVSGRISNLEVWDSRGYWKDYASITGDIALGSGSIGAGGVYGGGISGVAGFGNGGYEGAFYGPASGLETAGAWRVSGTSQGAGAVRKSIIGSFGARHVPAPEE